ncbi:MAG: HigA family addiction module antidote protein [Rickettsiales bacterium]|jgi:addiction module HigA family antidote|nr:HigA family addiction module antidote protein [Rickettsiales bacterium]
MTENEYIDVGTIGDYLREEWLEPLNLSHNRLAMAIGVPANRITDIVNGKRGISADTDLRLCKYFRMSDGHFLRMQDALERIPVRRKIADQLDAIVPYANDNAAARELDVM